MPLNLLSIASECAPWAKTGGLADVVAALCPALARQGIACRVLLPLYRDIRHLREGAVEVLKDDALFRGPVRVLSCQADGLDLLLIDAPHLYDRAGGIYLDEEGVDWPDNHLRFGLLGWLGAQIGRTGIAGWKPDVLHAHDWQAGLAPVYAHQWGAGCPSVLTIHNIAFQGKFPADVMPDLGLETGGFTPDGFAHDGQVSFLKGGLMQADRITTVSPTYARELLSPACGMGLEAVLAQRKSVLSGILNGIDTVAWDPARDPALAQNYTCDSLDAKGVNKQAVLARFGLDPDCAPPLFSVISRLSGQKGLDLVLQVLPDVLDRGARFVLLGMGEPALEQAFMALAERYPGRVGVRIGFDEGLAHLMQAGADATLVPSRFEPCGLTQLCSMRYGTLPIVSAVGGLADTVTDADATALAAGRATGFRFAPTTAAKLRGALMRAMDTYADSGTWREIQLSAMRHPVGWEASAPKLATLFRDLVGR